MSKYPWSKFYWKDYDADEGLRVCSLAAQGLWMRMLCIMAKSTPVGELRIGTEPCTVSDLARAVGETNETVGELLAELNRRVVFSVTRTGIIYNRRMRKAELISRKRAEAGEKGARVTNEKIRSIKGLPRQNGGKPFGKNPAPESRSQKEREETNDKDSTRPSSPRAPPSTPSSVEKLYAFEHGCVRLTEPDMAKWRRAFPHVAVEAELMSSEPWLAKQPSWFNAAAGKLAKLERQAIERINASARGPPKKRMIPSPLGGWVESPGFDMANQPIPDDDDD